MTLSLIDGMAFPSVETIDPSRLPQNLKEIWNESMRFNRHRKGFTAKRAQEWAARSVIVHKLIEQEAQS
jgi:hypothetical protein